MISWWIAVIALFIGYAFGFENGVNKKKKRKKEKERDDG